MNVGQHIAGYEIVAKLSSGGMATVYLGKRGGAGGFAKHVAIKVIHGHLADDPAFVEMFLDEARLSARLEHPNVVHVHDLGEQDGAYFMVMEYVAGCSLSQLLRVLGQKQLRLAPDVAAAIAMKVAAGLHAAHELTNEAGQNLGVVHRDVSPHNVLLAFKGHVKLIDFGVAKAAERSNVTQGTLLKGKVRYMAPEQAFGKDTDRRSDIYAIGILLWEMLTSRRLFDGPNDVAILEAVRDPKIRRPGAIVSGISPALDAIVMSALSRGPEMRPATCEILRQRLATAMPNALGIDAPHIADLLGVLMKEVVAAEHKKIGNLSQISMVLGAPSTSANAVEVVERLAVPVTATAGLPPPPARPAQRTTGPRAPPPRQPPPHAPVAIASDGAAAHAIAPPLPEITPAPVREANPDPWGAVSSTSSGVKGIEASGLTPQPVPIPAGSPVPVSPSPYLHPIMAPDAPRRRGAIAAAVGVVAVLVGLAGLFAWHPWQIDASPSDAPLADVEVADREVAAAPPAAVHVEPRAEEPPPSEPRAALAPEHTEAAAEAEDDEADEAADETPTHGGHRHSHHHSRRGSQMVDGVPLTSDVEF